MNRLLDWIATLPCLHWGSFGVGAGLTFFAMLLGALVGFPYWF